MQPFSAADARLNVTVEETSREEELAITDAERDPAARTADTATAPFTYAIDVGLLKSRSRAVDVEVDAAARAAIAAGLDIASLDAMRLTGSLAPWGRRGWRFDGRLVARAAQNCVVTLDAVAEAIDEPVLRIWSPDAARDVDVDSTTDGEDETPEPLGDAIDLGQIAVETLALALDPYPRTPDATLDDTVATPPGAEPLTDEAAKPFAGLAALRAAMTESDDPPDAAEPAPSGDKPA